MPPRAPPSSLARRCALASNRGGLPEIVGDAGFLFDIADRCGTAPPAAPRDEEIEPWIETIIRLWDDAAFYSERSEAARDRSKRWLPEFNSGHFWPVEDVISGVILHESLPLTGLEGAHQCKSVCQRSALRRLAR